MGLVVTYQNKEVLTENLSNEPQHDCAAEIALNSLPKLLEVINSKINKNFEFELNFKQSSLFSLLLACGHPYKTIILNLDMFTDHKLRDDTLKELGMQAFETVFNREPELYKKKVRNWIIEEITIRKLCQIFNPQSNLSHFINIQGLGQSKPAIYKGPKPVPEDEEWIKLDTENSVKMSVRKSAGPNVALLSLLEQIDKSLTKQLSNLFKEESKRLEVHLRHEARKVWWSHLTTTAIFNLSISWLKTIPIVGGYIGLAAKVIRNPAMGGYEVIRSSYGPDGKALSIFGDNSNGVMSPLTHSDKSKESGLAGYNLANGQPTLFQTNQRMKFEQAEAEVAAQIGGKIDNYIHNQSNRNDVNSSVKPEEIEAFIGNTTLLSTLERYALKQIYRRRRLWTGIKCLASVTKNRINSHDGFDDISSGRLEKTKNDKKYLCTPSELENLVDHDTSKPKIHSNPDDYSPSIKMTSSSNLYKVLHGAKFKEKYDGKTFIVKDSDRLAAQKTKVIYLAYYEELTKYSKFNGYLNRYVDSLFKDENDMMLKDAKEIMKAKAAQKTDTGYSYHLSTAMSFALDLLSVYLGNRFGTMTNGSDKTNPEPKYITYCLNDICMCAAYLMTKKSFERWDSWRKFFWYLLTESPEMKIYRDSLKEEVSIGDVPVGFSELGATFTDTWARVLKNNKKITPFSLKPSSLSHYESDFYQEYPSVKYLKELAKKDNEEKKNSTGTTLRGFDINVGMAWKEYNKKLEYLYLSSGENITKEELLALHVEMKSLFDSLLTATKLKMNITETENEDADLRKW